MYPLRGRIKVYAALYLQYKYHGAVLIIYYCYVSAGTLHPFFFFQSVSRNSVNIITPLFA